MVHNDCKMDLWSSCLAVLRHTFMKGNRSVTIFIPNYWVSMHRSQWLEFLAPNLDHKFGRVSVSLHVWDVDVFFGTASTPTRRWMFPSKVRWSETSWTWPAFAFPTGRMCSPAAAASPAPPAGRQEASPLASRSSQASYIVWLLHLSVCVHCSLFGGNREKTRPELSADEKVKRAFYVSQRYSDQVDQHKHSYKCSISRSDLYRFPNADFEDAQLRERVC